MKKIGNLFLDDMRIPEDVRWMYDLHEQYINSDWGMVRSYDEFVEFITKNGLPDETSFDYDLTDEHYMMKWSEVNYDDLGNTTGLHCAKWLIVHCTKNNYIVPKYYCHSLNPVNAANILEILNKATK